MDSGIEIRTRELPPALQRALDACGYHCPSISVRSAESVDPVDFSGDGYRAVFCLVNLRTGEHRITLGSWGGANAFTRNAIDGTAPGQDGQRIALTPDVCAIQGSEGGTRRTFRGSVYVHPAALAPLLPAPVSLDVADWRILDAVGGLTSAGRKEAFRTMDNVQGRISSLADRGLLKRNKAGAVSITVEGENARRTGKPKCGKCGGALYVSMYSDPKCHACERAQEGNADAAT